MSSGFESDLPPEFRAAMLTEIKSELPAFLSDRASEQPDPVGDVGELLNLDPADLQKVIRTHVCLDSAVAEFGAQLRVGIQRPMISSSGQLEASRSVRGQIDWTATLSRRSQDPTEIFYMVKPAGRHLDTPENRALLWLIDRLSRAAATALGGRTPETVSSDMERWKHRIGRLALQLKEARRVGSFDAVEIERPSIATIARLARSRERFYAVTTVAAIKSAMGIDSKTPEVITEALCQRYFEPGPTSLLFEVYVALRLAKAFREVVEDKRRRSRILVGRGERAPFATFGWSDGGEVRLSFQGWPKTLASSELRRLGERHGLKGWESIPDLIIERTGPTPGSTDGVVLELKASSKSSYLGKGLAELLSYVADRCSEWKKPAGWLIAPPSGTFDVAAPDGTSDVWIVDSDQIAAAALARFVPAST